MSDAPALILNDDGSNFLYAADYLDRADLDAYLARLEGTQVGMVCWCVAFGGYVTYYQSEITEPVGSGFALHDRVKQMRFVRNRERLASQVGDYCGYVFERLGGMGIPVLASFRMNDAHMSSSPTGPVAGRFWMNHRDWCLGEPFGYYGSCLDYTHPPVREYLRRLVLEVIGKFPEIAGVELDAMRSPFFFAEGEGREKAPIMTGFVRQIRRDLDEAAERTGRDRYLLRMNVPRDPDLALESGLDVAVWAEEGLVDGIAAGCYNTDFQIPLEQWQDLLDGRMPVHSYINCSPAMGVYLSREGYRGAAANAWGSGADGAYLFNFPCLDETSRLIPVPVDRPPYPTVDFEVPGRHASTECTRGALHELGDPKELATLDKRLIFYAEEQRFRHYAPGWQTLRRSEPAPVNLPWRCWEHTEAAREITIEIKLVGVTPRDEFAFAINGATVDRERIERLHASGGRDARVHAIPLEPYSVYTLEVDAGNLTRGDNTLTITLTDADPMLLNEIETREMYVDVRY